MQVKATKTMAAYLAERIPEYGFRMDRYSPEAYMMAVDYDVDRHMVDYSPKTGKFSAISVFYPEDFYALPKSLTTTDLSRAFRSSDRTEAGFVEAIREAIAI